MGNISIPTRSWISQPAFIIGGGPSLHGFDFERRFRNQWNVIGVKSVCEYLPWLPFYFSMDTQYFAARMDRLDKAGFKGIRYIAIPKKLESELPTRADIVYLWRNNIDRKGLSFDLAYLHGHNSGFSALNLAFLKGANPIFLYGLDFTKGGYWFDMASKHWVHPRPVSGRFQTRDEYISEQLEDFSLASKQLEEARIKVYVIGDTVLDNCFEKITDEDVGKLLLLHA